MAAVADRVIVELEAKLDRYNARVSEAERRFDSATRNMQRSANQLERSISANSTAIGSQLRGLAGTFAAAFSVQQITQYADAYTRFTNQLKVAGLEGQNLADRQNELFAIAQRYGVELESLGSLFSRVSQSSRDLGASQAEILQLAEGAAAGFKVQGVGAAGAAQAALGLVQALGSATVKAEEFNQINDAAPVLLQAVANNIDEAGGSVSRLRALVVDQKITNQEFFRAFLEGSAQLRETASQTSLTIANSFTILNNALGKYIGEADASLSATERLSQAIILLSENLDTVASAVGLLGAVLLGRYVAGLSAGVAATGAASAAIFALQARAIGAATTMEALGFAGAAAGRSLLAAFGGPVGIAVAALSVGIYYLATAETELERRTRLLTEANAHADAATQGLRTATDELATATGRARNQTLANARAKREETLQYIANTRAALANARAALAAAQASFAQNFQQVQNAARYSTRDGPIYAATRDAGEVQRRQEEVAGLEARIARATQAVERVDRVIAAGSVPNVGGGGRPSRGGGRTPRKPREPTGPSREEVEQQFERELGTLRQEQLRAQAYAADNADDRAEAEIELLAAQRAERIAQIEQEKNYTRAQKDALIREVEALYGRAAEVDADGNIIVGGRQSLMRLQIERERQRQIEQERAELAQTQYDIERDGLQDQYDLATSQADRMRLALELVDLEDRYRRSVLEAVIASETATAAEKERARLLLQSLDGARAANEERARRQNEGVGAKYLRELRAQDINEQLDQVRVRGLQSLEDKLVDVTAKIFKLGGAFGEIANQIISDLIRIGIQRAIIEPLAGALFGGGSGGGGGLFGSVLGSIFAPGGGIGGGLPGRASGGHIQAGQIYRVNETGIEGFQPAGSGKIIPLGQMNKARVATDGGGGSGIVHMPITVTAPGANAQTVELIRQTIADSAPTLIQAAQRVTIRNLSRRRMT